MFLSVKEALNNVVKHAQARRVELRITCESGALTIVIADDGRGLRRTAGPEAQHFSMTRDGLKNIESRMTEAQGTFVVAEKGFTPVVVDVVSA